MSFNVIEHTLPSSYIREYPRATAGDQEDVLELAVKQYVPRDNIHPNEGDITIIAAHANGFPKELYEPLWEQLRERLAGQGIRMRGIWIADAAWQGQSGVLNEDKLGNDPSWLDHSRDLLLLVNHFRSQIRRPIFGIGHSMGATQIANLAIIHPRLFTSLVLIDPVILRVPDMASNFAPARASVRRRDRWPSRQAAEVAFKKSKFYQSWDPRVLDLWLKYGLRDVPGRQSVDPTAVSDTIDTDSHVAALHTSEGNDNEVEVTLTTTRDQEVMTFLRGNHPTPSNPDPWHRPNRDTHADVDVSASPCVPLYRPEVASTFHKLPFLRPGVLYIFGETSNLSTAQMRADKLATTGTGVGGSGGVEAGRVTSVLVEGVGHLVPMEDVDATVRACTDGIVSELTRWRAVEEAERREWAAVPKGEKSKMSGDFISILQGDWSTLQVSPRKKHSKDDSKL